MKVTAKPSVKIDTRYSTRQCKGQKEVYYQFSGGLSFSVRAKMHIERKKKLALNA